MLKSYLLFMAYLINEFYSTHFNWLNFLSSYGSVENLNKYERLSAREV